VYLFKLQRLAFASFATEEQFDLEWDVYFILVLLYLDVK